MFQKTFHQFQIAEAKGHIPAGASFALTLAACMEGGCRAFHQEYYGPIAWAKESESIRVAEKQGEELVGALQESMLSDLTSTRSVLRAGLKEAHVTSDFALVLANLRDRSIRDGYTPSDSILTSIARSRPTSNFRLLQGVTISGMEDLEEQAEAEDVTYADFDYTEDGYKVAMYSKALKFTYQMWKNDDYGLVVSAMKLGGRKAKRLRAMLVCDALLRGLERKEYGGSAGGPTIDRLDAVITAQGSLKVGDEFQPRRVTDLLLPFAWQTTAQSTLNSQQVNRTGDKAATANPVLGAATPNVDTIWSEKAGKDWLAFDRNEEVVELSVLDDFEGGPRTVTKLPDVGQFPEAGAFSDHSIHVKWCDAAGSEMTPEGKKNATRVKGD